MSALESLSRKLKALAHPLRLKMVSLLAEEREDMYLTQIANSLGINRALAKIHLKKLEREDFVKSQVVLFEGKAKALRYYRLCDFHIHVSPKLLIKEVKNYEL